MSRQLPSHPNIEHLKKQAKDLLREVHEGRPEAVGRFRSLVELPTSTEPLLADALHAIARDYGFASWPRLKRHIESLSRPFDPRRSVMDAFHANDFGRVASLLDTHAELKAATNEPWPGSSFGMPPLTVAVQRGFREAVDALLRAGADINARTIWWAGSFGVMDLCAPDMVDFLVERGAVIDAHAAARLGMIEKVRELISEEPALVHARGGDGQTPLHFASTIEIAEYLLDKGADIDARDIDHESTPAQYMLRDRQDVARYLVSRGCRTDILMASALGDVDLVRKHLDDNPSSIRTNVSEEYFPKQDPRSGGTIYIWTLGWHKSAHVVAHDFGHNDVFALLIERSPAEVKLAQAAELADEDTFRDLLASEPTLVETLSDADRRKLVNAAQNNNTAVVRLMLSGGWPVDARGQHNATALHWAAWHGNAAMVRELLRWKAPIDIKGDDWDLTPLGWALHGSLNGWHRNTGDYAATVDELLRAGATPPPLTEDLEASEPARSVLRRYTSKE